MTQYFIGIDPGLSGAAVALSIDGLASYLDCPIYDGESDLKRHDSRQMFQWLLPYAGSGSSAILELVRVDSRDASHMVSAEKLIRTHESWRTALELLEIPTQQLYPVQWRKPLGLSGDVGETYVAEALRLYPDCSSWLYYRSRNGKWARNHNRAEALCMAHVARMQAMDSAGVQDCGIAS